jgi:IS30 family transposase
LALSLTEREEISRGVVAGRSMRAMTASLGRAPSSISREIRRNGGCRGYRASEADEAAWDRARRPKLCKLMQNRALARIVAQKLKRLWSPEQIAGWLKYTQCEKRTSRAAQQRGVSETLMMTGLACGARRCAAAAEPAEVLIGVVLPASGFGSKVHLDQ